MHIVLRGDTYIPYIIMCYIYLTSSRYTHTYAYIYIYVFICMQMYFDIYVLKEYMYLGIVAMRAAIGTPSFNPTSPVALSSSAISPTLSPSALKSTLSPSALSPSKVSVQPDIISAECSLVAPPWMSDDTNEWMPGKICIDIYICMYILVYVCMSVLQHEYTIRMDR